MIELNFSNMMEDVIGAAGLSENSLLSLSDRASDIQRIMKKRAKAEFSFMGLPGNDTSEIKKIARRIRKDSSDFLLLGIGGSALGPRAILEALSPFHNLRRRPRVFIYDNVDPRSLKSILTVIDLKRTCINVISKSGSTAETAASFMILWDRMRKIMPGEAMRNFILTTDPEKGTLRKIATENNITSLSIPPGVGGRYSVLSPVGLLTAEVIGIDADELLEGARDMARRSARSDLRRNQAYLFGALLYLMYKKKQRAIDVMVPYADGLKPLSEWFCQLWAESLGKNNDGVTPYPSLGATDQHSQLQLWMEGPEDKVIIFLKVSDFGTDIKIPAVLKEVESMKYLSGHTLSELISAEEEATELALAKRGRPSMRISIPRIDAYHLGQLFYLLEIATAFTGLLMEINPFDQPGVEEGKNLTYGMMGKKGFEERKGEVLAHRKNKEKWVV